MHGDTLRLEEVGLAHPGELEQLRRVERAAREDHLAARANFHRRSAAPALAIADASSALALEDQARRMHLGAHLKIRPLHRGAQEGTRGAHAATFQDRTLRVVDAEL